MEQLQQPHAVSAAQAANVVKATSSHVLPQQQTRHMSRVNTHLAPKMTTLARPGQYGKRSELLERLFFL